MQSKADFLDAFQRRPVEVPADGQKVHIRPLSPDDIADINAQPEGKARAAFALVRSVCAPDGTRLLEDADAANIGALIPHAASEDLLGEIARINRIGDHAKKAHSPATTS